MKQRLFFDKIKKTIKPFSQIKRKRRPKIIKLDMKRQRLKKIPMKFRKS